MKQAPLRKEGSILDGNPCYDFYSVAGVLSFRQQGNYLCLRTWDKSMLGIRLGLPVKILQVLSRFCDLLGMFYCIVFTAMNIA